MLSCGYGRTFAQASHLPRFGAFFGATGGLAGMGLGALPIMTTVGPLALPIPGMPGAAGIGGIKVGFFLVAMFCFIVVQPHILKFVMFTLCIPAIGARIERTGS